MRSSVIKGDPGYRKNTYGTIITVNGVRVGDCFTADEGLGRVWCWERNSEGRIIVENNKPKAICISGDVVITLPSNTKRKANK